MEGKKIPNQVVWFFSVLCAVSFVTVFFSPWRAAAILIGTLSLFFVLRSSEYIIYGLVLYIPFEPFLLKFVSDEVYVYARYFPEILIYLLFLVLITKTLAKKIPMRVQYITMLFFLFICVAILSAIVNHTPILVASLGIRQYIRFILIACIIVMLRPSKVFMKNVCICILALAMVEGSIGIIQAAVGYPMDTLLLPEQRKLFGDIQLTGGTTQFWESGQRIFATMGRYDQLGTFLSLALLLLTAFLFEYKRNRFLMYGAGVGTICISALVLTYSRAAWFGFFLGAIIIGIFLKRDRRMIVGVGIVSFVIAGYLFYSGIVVKHLTDIPSQTISQRFFEAFSLERWRGEYYDLGRMFFLIHTPPAIFAVSPLIGVGPGTYGGGTAAALHYTESYERLGLPFGIKGREGYIDNNWFSLLGEIGTIGLFLYLSMIGASLYASWYVWQHASDQLIRSVSLAYIGIAIAFIFQAFLATYLEMRTLASYVWLFAGIMLSEYSQMKEKKIL